mmetsp:Transcript_17909/g.39179  ORF Transcript_17909/g.39179 Transcript_17909/m.39179 type:complete len:302 (+) Transcript_17909:95-1000(+)
MSACCPPGSVGASPSVSSFLGASAPRGNVVDIPARSVHAGASTSCPLPSMPCYVTGASLDSPSLRRIVLVFTDVFGYESGNHRLFADVLASRLGPKDSTSVLIPDLFRGTPIAQPISFLPDKLSIMITLPAFLYRAVHKHRASSIERDLTQLILPWIQGEVSSDVNEIGLSCVGFCFGGWVMARSLGLAGLPMKCGVGAHPSLDAELLQCGDVDAMVGRTGTKPILLLPAGNDSKKIKVGGRHTKALAEARNVSEGTISVEFPDMKHGWVGREDGTNDDGVSKNQEAAMEDIVKFLEQNHA